MTMVDTTVSPVPGAVPPRLYRKRVAARLLDAALSFILSAVIAWPLASGAVSDALVGTGFATLGDLLTAWDGAAPLEGAVGAAVTALQPVLLTTIGLQVLVMWFYETLFTALSGATPGKAAQRVQVRFVPPPGLTPAEPSVGVVERVLRMALRAAVVVVPPVMSVAALVSGLLGVPGSGDLAEVVLAVTTVSLLAWVAGGRGLHGMLTRTHVVPFTWAGARQQVEQRAMGTAAEHLRRLQRGQDARSAEAQLHRLQERAGRALPARAQAVAQARLAEVRAEVEGATRPGGRVEQVETALRQQPSGETVSAALARIERAERGQ